MAVIDFEKITHLDEKELEIWFAENRHGDFTKFKKAIETRNSHDWEEYTLSSDEEIRELNKKSEKLCPSKRDKKIGEGILGIFEMEDRLLKEELEKQAAILMGQGIEERKARRLAYQHLL